MHPAASGAHSDVIKVAVAFDEKGFAAVTTTLAAIADAHRSLNELERALKTLVESAEFSLSRPRSDS